MGGRGRGGAERRIDGQVDRSKLRCHVDDALCKILHFYMTVCLRTWNVMGRSARGTSYDAKERKGNQALTELGCFGFGIEMTFSICKRRFLGEGFETLPGLF